MNLTNHFLEQLSQQPVNLSQAEITWNKRAAEVNKFTLDTQDPSLEFLNQHLSLKNKQVLEISFGAGRHLLEFAKQGAAVSGVEIAAKMLEFTQTKLAEAGLSQQVKQLKQQAWEEVNLAAAGWQEAFDLVFMYQSPAISSPAMLEKCLAASRKWLYFALYSHREDSLLTQLQKEFGLEVKAVGSRGAHKFYYLFNLLYQQGYFPNIHFEQRASLSEFEPEYILERYASWLWQGDELTEDKRQALLTRLKELANHQGKLVTNSRNLIGHLLVNKQLQR